MMFSVTKVMLCQWWINEWMCMERWWNDTDKRNHKYLEENMSHCHFVYHKFHLHWFEFELQPPWSENSDQVLEPWHGPEIHPTCFGVLHTIFREGYSYLCSKTTRFIQGCYLWWLASL